jgi:hypothetical protein
MNRIERIEQMEQYLNESVKAVRTLSDALEQYDSIQNSLKKLTDYFGSMQWIKDYEADEAGKLPPELKRGVLSEDAVYDLLTEHHELILRMSDAVTKAINKNMI